MVTSRIPLCTSAGISARIAGSVSVRIMLSIHAEPPVIPYRPAA
nr:MAG TPA: hypothetical protein [Bacteriophage sp.]